MPEHGGDGIVHGGVETNPPEPPRVDSYLMAFLAANGAGRSEDAVVKGRGAGLQALPP